MTECNIDMKTLAIELCKALNNDWRVVSQKIEEVVTIQHFTYEVQLRLRFVMSGKHEGQLRVSGLLCGNLIPFNPYTDHRLDGALPNHEIQVNPQRPIAAIKHAVEARLLNKVYQTMREAQHAYQKASEAKLRILDDEERLITASSNQLERIPQSKELTFYSRRRGRTVTVSVQDPVTVPGNVQITMHVDADEAEMVLTELFRFWIDERILGR